MTTQILINNEFNGIDNKPWFTFICGGGGSPTHQYAGGALSIIVCYVCAAVKTPIFSPKYQFQSIMISEETEIFTLFPFRRPPNSPFPVTVHSERLKKIRRRCRGASDFAKGERYITRPVRAAGLRRMSACTLADRPNEQSCRY